MPAMCIKTSQLHLNKQGLDAQATLQCDLVQDRGQGADFNRFVIRNSDGMRPWRCTAQNHVTSSLTLQSVADTTQTTQQLVTSQITRQLHAASRMRSSSKCSLIRPGFRAASAKWQLTASFTIASSSSHESPCVAIKPSGSRQSAVKPPSSAGRTLKISSRSFMP